MQRPFDESGTGIVGTAFGAVAFLALLAFATHVLIGLYATSVLSSAAFDSARLLATHPDDPEVEQAARTRVQDRLTGFEDVSVEIQTSPDDVALHVIARRPSLIPPAIASATRLSVIERTVHVRPETLR